MTLPRGLYDQVVTEALGVTLRALAHDEAATRDLAPDEAAERISEVFGLELQRILADHAGESPDRRRKQLALFSALLAHLRTLDDSGETQVSPIEDPPRLLHAIFPRGTQPPHAPSTGLTAPWLFTAGKGFLILSKGALVRFLFPSN